MGCNLLIVFVLQLYKVLYDNASWDLHPVKLKEIWNERNYKIKISYVIKNEKIINKNATI
jgi:hypothetical protein